MQFYETVMPVSVKRGGISSSNPKLAGNGNGSLKGSKTSGKTKTSAKRICFASIYPGRTVPLPDEFVALIKQLESKIKMPIWFLIQNPTRQTDGENYYSIDYSTFKGFQKHSHEMPNKKCALLIETPGGQADRTFHIAKMFQRNVENFCTIVPQYSKSAGTLLALSGNRIIMGKDAELGPLDVQIYDCEREESGSALNTVQSLERLNVFSISAIDTTLRMLRLITKKKTDSLLPDVLKFVSDFVRPLSEKIDTVDFAQKSRDLKVAEEYAKRLMKANSSYSDQEAGLIASRLVTNFPSHGFIIDREEAQNLHTMGKVQCGLKIECPSNEIEQIFKKLIPFLDTLTVIGTIEVV